MGRGMTLNETIKGWRIPQRVDIPNDTFKIRRIQTGRWSAVAQLSGCFWFFVRLFLFYMKYIVHFSIISWYSNLYTVRSKVVWWADNTVTLKCLKKKKSQGNLGSGVEKILRSFCFLISKPLGCTLSRLFTFLLHQWRLETQTDH